MVMQATPELWAWLANAAQVCLAHGVRNLVLGHVDTFLVGAAKNEVTRKGGV